MSAFDYILVGLWLFAALSVITQVGKPRKPLSPEAAAFTAALSLALIVGLLWTRGVL